MNRHQDQDPWFDDDAGPLVPAYALTRGRTSSNRHDLDMITLVVTVSTGIGLSRLEHEYREIVRFCGVPKSVAEISAEIRRPLAVTKVLVGDLIDDGYVAYRSPRPMNVDSADINLLRTVLDGIRAL
ncbi:DUF742 domain-containing protein [Nocardia sp. alder85J]|uniref:DUF742 domain-containing protein n=1 Tax=Nocardia sp. alder85J TaxID=2862949 RepID=UPI001CD720E4|nr:DUF742 domain-containing protein [Nocardia sp. alder85J]MCX4095757.1 DUF742 domain-containing protein [Nocardia sp. alder85J]